LIIPQAGAINTGLKVRWKYINEKNDTGEEAVFLWISVQRLRVGSLCID
jgi:hypothetical protein